MDNDELALLIAAEARRLHDRLRDMGHSSEVVISAKTKDAVVACHELPLMPNDLPELLDAAQDEIDNGRTRVIDVYEDEEGG